MAVQLRDRRVDYTDLCFKADAEIAGLKQVIHSANSRITSAQAEIDQIDAQTITRQEQRA